MVSVVVCHAGDRGSNPGGPESFFSSRRRGNVVSLLWGLNWPWGSIAGYTSLYGECKVYARLSSNNSKSGNSVVTWPYLEILTASLSG